MPRLLRRVEGLMRAVTLCEPCGASSWEVVRPNVMGRGADLRRCLACGFKTYDRVLVEPEQLYRSPAYDEIAARSFRFRTMVAEYQRDELVPGNEAAARGMYAGLLERVEAAVVARPIRLFEIGGGWGRLLAVASERGGYSAQGCDLSDVEAASGRSLGLDVQAGDFLALPLAGPFDAVVALDLLEHVWRPRAVVERAVSLLAPGGVLLVKTFYDEYHDHIDLDLSPSAADLSMGGRSHGYFDPLGHPSHFDLPVLRALLVRCGLVIRWEHVEPIWGQVAILGARA